MVYCTKLVSMEEALGMADGSIVDVFAVVASIGPLILNCSREPLLLRREICLVDSIFVMPRF